jgi:hypothetical protein
VFRFKQSFDKFDYVWSLFLTFSHFCKSYPFVEIGKRRDKRTISIGFYTRSMPCFTKIYNKFYSGGSKIIPNNIYELLDSIALAHFIMGDGSYHLSGLVLCTDSYNVSDVIRLMNVLFIKFQLDCTLQFNSSGKPRIYIKSNSMVRLQSIVAIHMVDSMKYKIHL